MPVVHDETDEPGDITVNARSQHAPQVSALGDFLSGTWTGIKKGGASMVPASIEGQELKDWSHSPATGGWAETAGEWTGDIGANLAPFAIGGPIVGAGMRAMELPGIASETASALGTMALRARTSRQAAEAAKWIRSGMNPADAWAKASQVGNRAYNWIKGAGEYGGKALEASAKGAAGGGAEAAIQNEDEKDPRQFWSQVGEGTLTGGVTAGEFTGGRMAYEALPAAVKHLIGQTATAVTVGGAGLTMWDKLGHSHFVPWHLLYMAAKPLYETGRLALRTPSSLVGGGSEYLREHPPSLTGWSVTKGGGDELAPSGYIPTPEIEAQPEPQPAPQPQEQQDDGSSESQ